MRINLFGGPGSGKSTTAAWLFAMMKKQLISVELVTEYVKAWACQKRQIRGFDQVYLFGKQMQYEYRFLSSGIKNIVTDSPTFLSPVYAKLYMPNSNMWKSLVEINLEYDKEQPATNIFLLRGDKPYIQEGRYQDKEGAMAIDVLIREMLEEFYPKSTIYLPYADSDKVLAEVLSRAAR